MLEQNLDRAIIASEVTEAIANYARADEPLLEDARLALPDDSLKTRDQRDLYMHDDCSLWHRVLYGSESGQAERNSFEVHFRWAAVSEWVARIPGLIWRRQSSEYLKYTMHDERTYSQRLELNAMRERVGSQLNRWENYTLPMESVVVSGGVGTLRLPAATDGYRLVTLTSSLNASSGVPTLVAPNVWHHLRMSEGVLIGGQATWRDMPLQWVDQFPIVSGIPRGCLVLDDPDEVHVVDEGNRAPILVHPFSVMEYWDGQTLLHDFIFAAADTSYVGYRKDLENFFERHRHKDGRDGRYLLSADVAQPIWDATYGSPAEMQTSKGPELRLLQERVKEVMIGQDCIDSLRRMLSDVETHADLKRLSEKAGIPFQRWAATGISHAEHVVRLIDAAVQADQQQALLYAVKLEFPQ